MDLILGGLKVDRTVHGAENYLRKYREDIGRWYLDYAPNTPPEKLLPEDIAVTLLVNSRASGDAVKSLIEHGDEVDLPSLATVPLEDTTPQQRNELAKLIAKIAEEWKGFACSLATKLLHKKKPDLVPVLDNEAIFGAYRNPRWPQERARTASITSRTQIRDALDCIWTDLNRTDNAETWAALHAEEPKRSRIQLFDSVWWIYFRKQQPV